MKIIDAYWEEVLKLNCNCLGGDDSLIVHRDKSFHDNEDKEAYYVKFVDDGEWGFKTRLRTFFKFRKDWKKFINGAEQTYNGIYLNLEQLSEFYSTLYEDALTHEIIVKEDIEKIESFILSDNIEKYPWSNKPNESLSEIIFFKSEDDLVLSADIWNNGIIGDFKFSWAFYSKITKKEIRRYTRRFLLNKKNKFMCQEYELFLNKNDIINLFSIINYILNNVKLEEDKFILEL